MLNTFPPGSYHATWLAPAFLEGVREERLFPLWRFYAMTGTRRGEALGLRWCDVDLRAAATVSIVQARTPHGISTPKTERGVRLLDLDAETVKILKQWRRDQLQERMEWGELWTDTGLVFTREDGHGSTAPRPAAKRRTATATPTGGRR